MAKQPSKVTEAETKTQAPSAEPGLEDTIAGNRAAEPVRAEALPSLPKGFRSVDIEERRQRISWVSEEHVAELKLALLELATHGPKKVSKDLGELAPDVSKTRDLAQRIDGLESTLVALEALQEAHTQMLEIAYSDAHRLVTAAQKEIDHRSDRVPELVKSYQRVSAYSALRGKAVSEGRAKKGKGGGNGNG